MAILFPAGSTCETYEYGWQSTGCTGDDGATRGFTQEWYFDGDLAAWVAVSQDISVTGPAGPTGGFAFDNPDAGGECGTHFLGWTGPEETDDVGTLRRFLVLADDGSITFDYIKTPDLVRPTDVGASYTSFAWTNRTANDLDAGSSPYNGWTLCAPGNYVYTWNSGSSDIIFTAEFGSSLLSTAPTGITVQLQSGYDTTLVHGLPKTGIAGKTGELRILTSDLVGGTFGISAGAWGGGPTYDWVKFEGRALLGTTHETKADNNTLKTENYYYVFATGSDFIANPGSVTGSGQFNIPDAAKNRLDAAGTYKLLPQGNSVWSDHTLDITISPAELGNAGTDKYVYIAFPTRVGVTPDHLYYSTALNAPNGFRTLESITMDIPNEFGYNEPYLVYRSQSAAGVPAASGIDITKS